MFGFRKLFCWVSRKPRNHREQQQGSVNEHGGKRRKRRRMRRYIHAKAGGLGAAACSRSPARRRCAGQPVTFGGRPNVSACAVLLLAFTQCCSCPPTAAAPVRVPTGAEADGGPGISPLSDGRRSVAFSEGPSATLRATAAALCWLLSTPMCIAAATAPSRCKRPLPLMTSSPPTRRRYR